MVKKVVIGGLGLALVLGLLFGSNLVPYASHTIGKLRQKAKDKVPVSIQIGTARDQLKSVDKEIKTMMREVAMEEIKINKIQEELGSKKTELAVQESHIMRLKSHLDSGDEVFVTRNRTFTNERVRDDLRNRFEVFKKNELTLDKLERVLDLRGQGLVAAKEKLQETQNQRRELEVEIEHLVAHNQMMEVAKTSSKLNLDDSKLSQTREMVEDIRTRLEVDAQMLDILPQYAGQIPLGDELENANDNISAEIEDWQRNRSGNGEVVTK